MAITASPYGVFLTGLGAAEFDMAADTFKVLLTTSSYTPNIDTHNAVDDVTNEVTGTGYTAGGEALTGVAWTYDSANNRAVMAADPVVWSAADFTARLAVVYKDTGTPSTSTLIGWIDFGSNRVFASEDFQLSFSAGAVRIKAA